MPTPLTATCTGSVAIAEMDEENGPVDVVLETDDVVVDDVDAVVLDVVVVDVDDDARLVSVVVAETVGVGVEGEQKIGLAVVIVITADPARIARKEARAVPVESYEALIRGSTVLSDAVGRAPAASPRPRRAAAEARQPRSSVSEPLAVLARSSACIAPTDPWR